MTFIDTHCHLQFEAFKNDAASTIDRAKKAGCEALIVVGAMLDSSENAVGLARKHDGLFAAVGIHPHHADKVSDNDIEILERLATSKSNAARRRVVAIGEIGLDYHPYDSNDVVDKQIQKGMLEAQFSLAQKLSLPIIIHCRDAWPDLLPLVAQYIEAGGKPGVFHCWSGTMDDAEHALDLGFFISFAGNITYPAPSGLPASSIQTVAKTIPLDRLLLETDSPYLAPQPVRGQRNEPAFIRHTAEFLANLRGISLEELADATTANAKRLFGIQV